MDLHMPELDGIETAKRIRANPDYYKVPIVALTAAVLPEDRKKCLDAGMKAFLPKPISLRGLSETLKSLFI
jgi:CheY-like chemotaxis protein